MARPNFSKPVGLEVKPRRGTFSVVVPCYNYGRFLPSCLGSIMSQTNEVEVEVLIIDDCSTDDSAAVAEELGRQYPNVTVIAHEVNRGHIATYNEGIDWATGDYFVLLSADDMLGEGALGRVANALDPHPNIGLAYGPVAAFYSESEIRQSSSVAKRTVTVSGERWIRQMCRVGENIVRSPEAVVRTSVQKVIGHYDPAFAHTGDMHMWLRAAMVSDVAYLRGGVQAYYRLHGQNMSRTTFADRLVQLEQVRSTFEDVLAGQTSLRLRHDRRIALTTVAKWALWEGSKAYQHGPANEPFDPAAFEALAARADARYRSRLAFWGFRFGRQSAAGHRSSFLRFCSRAPVAPLDGSYVADGSTCMPSVWRGGRRKAAASVLGLTMRRGEQVVGAGSGLRSG